MSTVTTVDTTTKSATLRGCRNANTLLFTPGGQAFWMYNDGSNLVFSTAMPPYTSWVGPTTIDAGGNAGCGAYLDPATEDIHVVYKDTARRHRKLSRSSGTWSIGSETTIVADGASEDHIPRYIWRERTNRLWTGADRWTGSAHHVDTYYSDDNGATWTVSASDMTGGVGTVGQNGGYGFYHSVRWGMTLFVYGNSNTLYWRRRFDGDTATTWTSVQSKATQNTYNDHRPAINETPEGELILAYAPSDGGSDYAIRTWRYDRNGDTFATAVDIGNATNDEDVATAAMPDGLAIGWSLRRGSNDYDTTAKMVRGAGHVKDVLIQLSPTTSANRRHPLLAPHPNGQQVGVAWREGTSSPWDLNFSLMPISRYQRRDSIRELYPLIIGAGAAPTSYPPVTLLRGPRRALLNR